MLLPGAGSTRTAVLAQAAVLARHGYGAILVDTRGHGRSGGHAMDFGWWGDRDIAASVSFLASQPGVHAGAIALLGESMGGEQALAAAGSDPRIRAVVAGQRAGLGRAARRAYPGPGYRAPGLGSPRDQLPERRAPALARVTAHRHLT